MRWALVINVALYIIFNRTLAQQSARDGKEREQPKIETIVFQLSEYTFPGLIQTIQFGNFDSEPQAELAILGQTDLMLFDPIKKAPKKFLKLRTQSSDYIWLGLRPIIIANPLNILNRGEGYSSLALHNNQGSQIWKSDISFIRETEVLENGGDVKIVTTAPKGTYFYDRNGRELHKISESDSHLAKLEETKSSTVALYNDRNEIVTILDASGTRKARIDLAEVAFIGKKKQSIYNKLLRFFSNISRNAASDISMILWKKEVLLVVLYSGNRIELVNLKGELVKKIKLTGTNRYKMQAESVLAKSGSEYIAILLNGHSSDSNADLLIFDETGNLVLQKKIDKAYGIKKYRLKGSRGDMLAVGEGASTLHLISFETL